MAQTLKVLLWKMCILRKRRWFITFLEVAIPILMFWLLVYFKNILPDSSGSQKIIYEDPSPYKYVYPDGKYKLAYTSLNNVSDTIMNDVFDKINRTSNAEVEMVRLPSEAEVVSWLRSQYINETANTSAGQSEKHAAGVGVIFSSASGSQLQYTLRTTNGNMRTDEDTRYGGQTSFGYNPSYVESGFLVIQAIIDQSYLENFQSVNVSDNVLVGLLPFIEFSAIDVLSLMLPFYVTVSFTFLMPSLIRGIVEEKSSGFKEMMKIMGLKPWLNWLHWLLYSLFVYIPVSLVVVWMLTIYTGTSSPAVQADYFSVWIIFLLFALAFIAWICAVTTFFTNGTIGLIVAEVVWNVVSALLNSVFTNNPAKYPLWVHLVTCLWPSLGLQWSLNTIAVFHKNGKDWSIDSLFDDDVGGGSVSVGHACVMLIVDVILYSVITWYMDNVRPGPFGRARPFYFVVQCFKGSSYEPNAHSGSSHNKNYEVPPDNVNVGISIQSLRKTFNSGKVVAVENVDLDIYEGNITALLGHNGAGKTTTMSMLTGFFSPSSGKIIVKGKNIFDNIDKFRSSLGLCPQHNLLFSFFTVLEHLIFFGMLKGMSKSKSEDEGLKIMRSLKIEEKKNELVKKLSGGMKRKLCLAISLMGDPEVLVLDEPTSGLDPESRRQVWDMLLEFRGQRTMIISTHFMEEADVLGDRIAIMDHGKVSCYGTSMFLKKVYGTGYHLNITKKESHSVSEITSVVEQNVMSASPKLLSPTQLTYVIRSDELPQLPALFSALERWSKQLGITNMSVNCTTMEDVFLKVAAELQEPETDEQLTNEEFTGKHTKVKRLGQLYQQVVALVYKKSLSKWRTPISSLIYTVVPILLTGYFFNRTMDIEYTPDQPDMLVSLASLPNVRVAALSDDARATPILQNIVQSGHAIYDNISTGTDLKTYLDNEINNHLVQYQRHLVAGFVYNSNVFVSGYSYYFTHSSSVVYNMIANTLLQLAHPGANISVYNHPIVVKTGLDVCDLALLAKNQVMLFPMVTMFVSLAFMILTMGFISFPLKERVSRAKQLQLMTGVSPFLYWLTNFVCDFVIYFVTAVLMVCTLFMFQTNDIYSSSGYLGTLILLVALFGVSGIMFAYFFSFLIGSSIKASVLYIMFNMLTGTVAAVLLCFLEGFRTIYAPYRYVFSFNPLFTITYAITGLVSAMYIDGTCVQCGKKDCKMEDPLSFLEPGMMSDHPYGIYNHILFLILDAVLYFSLVMMIEYGLIKNIWFFVSKLWIKWEGSNIVEDGDVLGERQRVNASKSLTGHISSASILYVDNLGKKYNNKLTAVHGVNFQVGRGECFGLLGVNGAGKTTTFKMLTGEEIPNKGDAKVLQYSLNRQKSQFLGKIGYCPQFDAINKLLTGREMLYVYALLRGIPSSQCDSEVSRWLQIMGLKEYSDRRCGTYSGGNKRKLSTAMAFIGAPAVVFLDEPTSGVDPVSRRKLWHIMSQCQQAGQAIVLTSHSMEECEALCSRLTIMVAGRMKCIGSASYLKHKFGQGYTVKIKLRSTQQSQDTIASVKHEMSRWFRSSTVKDEHLGLLHYHIPDPTLKLSQLFGKMELLKQAHRVIEDYIVSDTSLEEVFMSFARAA